MRIGWKRKRFREGNMLKSMMNLLLSIRDKNVAKRDFIRKMQLPNIFQQNMNISKLKKTKNKQMMTMTHPRTHKWLNRKKWNLKTVYGVVIFFFSAMQNIYRQTRVILILLLSLSSHTHAQTHKHTHRHTTTHTYIHTYILHIYNGRILASEHTGLLERSANLCCRHLLSRICVLTTRESVYSLYCN